MAGKTPDTRKDQNIRVILAHLVPGGRDPGLELRRTEPGEIAKCFPHVIG
jgi:hypothetical protein